MTSPPAALPPPPELDDLDHAVWFTPDGKSLAVLGGKNATARLWEWGTSRPQLRRLLGGVNGAPSGLAVTSLASAPDGRSVAISGHGLEPLQIHDLGHEHEAALLGPAGRLRGRVHFGWTRPSPCQRQRYGLRRPRPISRDNETLSHSARVTGPCVRRRTRLR
jgi:hypothetical protein